MSSLKQQSGIGGAGSRAGFSLLEVMIAIGIFFMVAFSVLALVSQCLRQAAALEQVRTPMGSLAAQVFATNHLEEGYDTGDFDDLFPGYRWTREVVLLTNGFYEVYLTVSHDQQRKPESELLVHRYQPDAGSGRTPGRPLR
jgi:hypothetical protein